MSLNVNINTSAASTQLVANPTNNAYGPYSFIRVWAFDMTVSGAGTVSLQDNTGTVYWGPGQFAANGGEVKNQPSGSQCFDLPRQTALLLVTTGSPTVGGSLQYQIMMP